MFYTLSDGLNLEEHLIWLLVQIFALSVPNTLMYYKLVNRIS